MGEINKDDSKTEPCDLGQKGAPGITHCEPFSYRRNMSFHEDLDYADLHRNIPELLSSAIYS